MSGSSMCGGGRVPCCPHSSVATAAARDLFGPPSRSPAALALLGRSGVDDARRGPRPVWGGFESRFAALRPVPSKPDLMGLLFGRTSPRAEPRFRLRFLSDVRCAWSDPPPSLERPVQTSPVAPGNGGYSPRAALAVVDQLDVVDGRCWCGPSSAGGGSAPADLAVRHVVCRAVCDACLAQCSAASAPNTCSRPRCRSGP